ncbi:MAG: UBP-type zinc finger domain-containing protein [Thermoleophilia bacterium]
MATVPPCSHLDQVLLDVLPDEVAGCEECLRIGDGWVHLRICLTCGKVGCCDSSPNRHASRHAAAEGHPLIRSLEPGEEWTWCFVEEVGMVLRRPTGTTRIPKSPLLP